MREKKTLENIWHCILIGEPDQCWEWQGGCRNDGYGNVHFGDKTYPAHRMALISAGVEIPHGMFVLHKCDNRKCCNPNHLFIGTHTDNVRDAVSKGKFKFKRRLGKELSETEKYQICDAYEMGISKRKLAEIHGIHRKTVAHIVSRRTQR